MGKPHPTLGRGAGPGAPVLPEPCWFTQHCCEQPGGQLAASRTEKRAVNRKGPSVLRLGLGALAHPMWVALPES